ncbi:hypothetical protein KS4_07840 [Poriferisphaera corsica]|uniref:Uncharacterized protein n=1 Tax=Poriferisphaera corsica TaxID=2528020 RepID=A0A517YRA4_9BACT|nr:hypothetical protein [Poriferisphaera corsica]QDU32750.1 hypothetical protein KS4_07840 [Poriferisphaera corsica]
MTKTLKTVSALCVLAVVAVSLTGCGTMTPELMSGTQAAGDMHYKWSRVMDNSSRTAWNDFERLFFLDQNSQANPFVSP